MPETLVFIDTMMFLHYNFVDQVDLPALLSTPKVNILVIPAIVRELNKHKDQHPIKRMRHRAANTIRKLMGYWDKTDTASIRPGVRLEYHLLEPSIDFSHYNLAKEIADDWLIASVIEYRILHPDAEVLILTADMNVKLKARALSINSFSLPDTYKLPEDPDPNEVTIKDLEKQLLELQRRIPKPRVMFENGDQLSKIELQPPALFDDASIASRIDQLRRDVPHQSKDDYDSPFYDTITGAFGKLDFSDYNRRVDRYYIAYEEYLNELANHPSTQNRVIVLRFIVDNTGTAPADDLDIFFNFPNGFEVFEEDEFPPKPEEPAVPDEPMTPMAKTMRNMLFPHSSLIPRLGPLAQGPPPNVSKPRIRETNSYEVKFHVNKLKHGMAVGLDPLYLVFPSFDRMSSFQVEYIIYAANVPEAITGQLHVVLERPTVVQQ